MKIGALWVGTSGIAIPGAKQNFPEEYKDKSRLHYHASIFNTLEVNSSFYKVPMAKTLERWVTDVPDDFRFTLKLHRAITHEKELAFNWHDIAHFMDIANSIGLKKGCLLVQFPASITSRFFSKVKDIILLLSQADPGNTWRKAFEFRHSSWYTDQTEKLLEDHQATLVLHDMPKSRIMIPTPHVRFIYMRFHGPTGNYKGSYSDEALREAGQNIRTWLADGLDVYVYFNNTIGDAFQNAQRLRGFVTDDSPRKNANWIL